MAATVEISETNGASGSPATTDGILNINFGGADLPNLTPSAHPVVLSASSKTYSMLKWLRFHLISLGGSASVGGLQVWKSSGAYVTAELIGSNMAGNLNWPSYSVPTYAQATNHASNVAITTPYSGDGGTILGGGDTWSSSVMPTSAPGSTNLTIAGSTSTNLTGAGYSDYCLMALNVSGLGGTPSGAVNQKVITFQYNES